MPEQAFYMMGTIDEAREEAAKLAKSRGVSGVDVSTCLRSQEL